MLVASTHDYFFLLVESLQPDLLQPAIIYFSGKNGFLYFQNKVDLTFDYDYAIEV